MLDLKLQYANNNEKYDNIRRRGLILNSTPNCTFNAVANECKHIKDYITPSISDKLKRMYKYF